MSALKTAADLIDYALKKSGEKIDGTSDYEADALDYMNELYRTILAGGNEFDTELAEPWEWAKSKYPGVLILEPSYSSGTVSLTQDSSAGTFSSAPLTSQQGKYLKIDDRAEYYRISSHSAGVAAFTLDSNYADETGAALNYKAIKLDYDLDAASILRLIGPMTVYLEQVLDTNQGGIIEGMDFRAFERKHHFKDLEEGIPTAFAVVHEDDGVITVRFNKYPTNNTRVEYNYIPIPTELSNDASSIPLIPVAYRKCLATGTAHFICVDKEDTKSDYFYQVTQATLRAMVGANRKEKQFISKNRGKIFPRLDLLRRNRWDIRE